MKTTTTHEMARQLLALPDVPLHIEMWCQMEGYEMMARMTEFDPEGTAIIMQERVDPDALKLPDGMTGAEAVHWAWDFGNHTPDKYNEAVELVFGRNRAS